MLSDNSPLPNLNANIRFLNTIPLNASLDIYVNNVLYSSHLEFSKTTPYKSIVSGEYVIDIYPSGDKTDNLYSDTAVILPNSVLTFSIVLVENDFQLFTLTDGNNISSLNRSFIRIINLSPDSPLLTLSLSDGTPLYDGIEFIETTNYSSISSGMHDFILSETENPKNFKRLIENINLEPGLYHTFYLIGMMDASPQFGYLLTRDGV